ncbi:MAG: hypothetical protein ACRD0C_13850 [Acidimicrobiia bacterium]
MTEAGTSMLLFVRAEGCSTPALLMTPEAEWPVKLFQKIALSTLRADKSQPRVAVNRRTGEVIAPDAPLGDAGFLPYDMMELRFDG